MLARRPGGRAVGGKRGRRTRAAALLRGPAARLRPASGQTSVEYLGVLVAVAAIVAVLATSGLGGVLASAVEGAICTVAGSCEEDGSGAPAGPAEPPAPPAPSDDYQSWLDPERRALEFEQLYGDTDPSTIDFDTYDFQGRDSGRVRIGLFIMDETAGPPGLKLKGDDRGFDSQFSPNRTRTYIEFDFETDTATVVVNPSCDAGGDCSDAKGIGDGSFGDFSNEVELEEEDDGTLHLSYELSQSKGTPIPGISGPSIDGDINIRPNEDGSFTIEHSGDDFPSIESYYDDGDGNTEELILNEEDNTLGPLTLFPIIE